MSLLFVLLLDSWQVVYGQALLDGLKSYDILRYEVSAEPVLAGLDVDCRIVLRVTRPGPLRFLLSGEVSDLRVERDGSTAAVVLDEGGLGRVVRWVAGETVGLPVLLAVGPDPAVVAGERATLRLRYVWRPSGRGAGRAGPQDVQTHLASFWLPSMADEMFEAELRIRTDLPSVATGERVDAPEGTRAFRTTHPAQVLCLVAGDYRVERSDRGGRPLTLLLPVSLQADAGALLEDLSSVLAQLEAWFGPALDLGFTLVVDASGQAIPSYCGGSFAVVDRRALPPGTDRAHWLAHLAHECAHVWWGHRLATPVIGRGGTWLREGLAEWTGVKVAGALLGEDIERALFREHVHGYLARVDLRAREGPRRLLFANEPTLLDASYLDGPRIAYLRGALVHRGLEALLGEAAFRATLRSFCDLHAYRFATGSDFADAVGASGLVAYYAGTTRLPDLVLDQVEVTAASVRGVVTCADPAWPGAVVPCLVRTPRGSVRVEVAMRDGRGTLAWDGEGPPLGVEVDPERIFLDPVGSNNVWPRAPR